jgi:hypothetical protein
MLKTLKDPFQSQRYQRPTCPFPDVVYHSLKAVRVVLLMIGMPGSVAEKPYACFHLVHIRKSGI